MSATTSRTPLNWSFELGQIWKFEQMHKNAYGNGDAIIDGVPVNKWVIKYTYALMNIYGYIVDRDKL